MMTHWDRLYGSQRGADVRVLRWIYENLFGSPPDGTDDGVGNLGDGPGRGGQIAAVMMPGRKGWSRESTDLFCTGLQALFIGEPVDDVITDVLELLHCPGPAFTPSSSDDVPSF